MSALPDPGVDATIDAKRTAKLYGVSVRAAYDGANRWIDSGGVDGIPAIRCGRSVRFLTAPCLRQLGLLGDARAAGEGAIVHDIAELRGAAP